MSGLKLNYSVVAAGLLLVLLFGCSVQNVRQLDRYKDLAAKGDDAAIVAEPVSCSAAEPGCDQLHLIHGMSCYREAKRGVDTIGNFECAIADLGTGLEQSKVQGQTAADGKPYAEAELESIRGRIDESSNWAEASSYVTLLQQRADQFRATYPDAQAGFYYGATARLLSANQVTASQPLGTGACNLLLESQQLLEQSRKLTGALSANIDMTLRQVLRLIRQECTA